MAFGRSEFDVLKDLNMKPEEIRAALEENKKLKETQTKLEADFTKQKESFATMENGYNEVRTKLGELEASSRTRETQTTERPPKTSFIEDEDRAFGERFAEHIGPVAQTALIAAKNSAKMAAKMSLQGQYITTPGGRISLPYLWTKWEREIDDDSKQIQLAALGDMNTWINIFNYIKGKHINEMMAEPQTFVESVQTSTNVRVGEDKKDDDKLNTEESAVIKKMSKYSKFVTPEKYQETKKKMTFVGDIPT